jgi:hypothetical protein
MIMADKIRLDAALVRAQIERLRTEFPDVWDSEEFAADALEGETDLYEWLVQAEAMVLEDELTAQMLVNKVNAYAEHLGKRAKRLNDRAVQLRGVMLAVMEAAGIDKAKLPTATISVKDKPPSVQITDEALLPLDFIRTTRAPDKTAIAKALKAGETVDGAVLTNGGRTLAIRR